MNNLGKGLVLANLAMSLLALGWAVGVYASPVDWGRKEAHRVWNQPADGKNERIAAKIDERTALMARLKEDRVRALARVQAAQEKAAKAEERFGFNHLAYVYELARLDRGQGDPKKAPKDLTEEERQVRAEMDYLVQAGVLTKAQASGKALVVREVKFGKDGAVALSAAQFGLPVFEKIVPGLDRPYAEYLVDYYNLVGEAKVDKDGKVEEIRKGILSKLIEANDQLIAEKAVLTKYLNGERQGDKLITPGLYDLQEVETEIQRRLREEKAYLQPLWVQELYNAQLLRSRRLGLEKRLRELGVSPESVMP